MARDSGNYGRSGFVARHALWSDAAHAAAEAALRTVEERKLEVVRISFVDQHGVLRGKTVLADALASTFRSGVTITSTLLLKDTSHRTVFPVWQEDAGFGAGEMTGAGDLLMVPDPTTFKVLPWSPESGWMLADLYHIDGRPVALSTRTILRDALARLEATGRRFVAGLEVEFHVLRVTDPRLGVADSGQPEAPPDTELLSHGFQYLTEERFDRLEDVFTLVRRNGLGLGLPLRSLEAEFGPSQCEVTFDPADGMAQADNMVLFRSMVKQVCRRAGLHATFMCRPRFPDSMASGWHLHQSLVDAGSGANLFMPDGDEPISAVGRRWIAGILAHARESCLLSTPTINGYKRYRPFTLAPDRIQWGRDNRGAMIRSLAGAGDAGSRIENRIGEPAANPYLYFASQVLSGLDGLERGLEPPPPVERPYDSDAEVLPRSLVEALDAFQGGGFYRRVLGDTFVDYLATIKRAEWQRYLTTVSEWEEREYFSLF
ncbi:glutamine synthetase family protein [Azospirillum sp. ST 5-10]|uniref:glutamine synthetase family protein n=1 Tax=unclassified Azospirillum TaxID=2630922 RepID=UPI003F4A155B